MSRIRFDSLFARLLLLQSLVAVALLIVFGLLVYVDQNMAVARLVAERWAPTLRLAAGLPSPSLEPLRPLLHSAELPAFAWPAPLAAPRMVALENELERRGVSFEEAAISRGDDGPTLWLRIRRADGSPPSWIGLTDTALLPRLPGRLLAAIVLSAVLLVALSWYFTRRLTRPLEALRERMLAHRPGEPVHGEQPIERATPEVAAIETAYDELLRRLERHERERALLLAGVSHDLRSPLARIRMAAGLLPEAPESVRWREAIARNVDVADRLIGSFLDHVRAGELPLGQPADLADVARRVAAERAHDDEPPTLDVPPSLILSRCHPLLLERLVANLLDNAYQHGRTPVSLAVRRQAGVALVEVGDAGLGIPEAERELLTEAFARGDASRGTPGLGLGLAIVSRIVARLGGTLAFERRGARHLVCVALPIDL